MSRRRPSTPLGEAIRANATLLHAMARGEIRLERAALLSLVQDMREWATEIDAAQLRDAREAVTLLGHVQESTKAEGRARLPACIGPLPTMHGGASMDAGNLPSRPQFVHGVQAP